MRWRCWRTCFSLRGKRSSARRVRSGVIRARVRPERSGHVGTMMKRRRCEHCDSGRGLNPTERGLVPASLPCFSSSVCASWTSPLFNSSFLYAPVSTSPRSGSEPRSIINERWKVSVVESSFLNFGLNSRWTPVCSVRPLTRFLWLIIIFLCGSLEDTPHCDAQYGGVAWTPAETFERWMLQVCGLCDACY